MTRLLTSAALALALTGCAANGSVDWDRATRIAKATTGVVGTGLIAAQIAETEGRAAYAAEADRTKAVRLAIAGAKAVKAVTGTPTVLETLQADIELLRSDLERN